jgi:hypothetical protein
MKYIKHFENKMIEDIDSRWSPFTKEMYKKYCDMCDLVGSQDISQKSVKNFFKSLEEEYLESDEWTTFQISQTFRSGSKTFYGLANAHGPFEACLKMAFHYDDPELIFEYSDTWDVISIYEVEEDTISGNISRLESEIEKWKNVL